jgi:hypothetical protein
VERGREGIHRLVETGAEGEGVEGGGEVIEREIEGISEREGGKAGGEEFKGVVEKGAEGEREGGRGEEGVYREVEIGVERDVGGRGRDLEEILYFCDMGDVEWVIRFKEIGRRECE